MKKNKVIIGKAQEYPVLFFCPIFGICTWQILIELFVLILCFLIRGCRRCLLLCGF